MDLRSPGLDSENLTNLLGSELDMEWAKAGASASLELPGGVLEPFPAILASMAEWLERQLQYLSHVFVSPAP